jgi:hypothetical protein
MRPAGLCWIIIGSGLLTAQHQQRIPSIRSISVKVVSTSAKGLTPIEFHAITAAWKSKQVDLAVEGRLDIASIDKAKEVIRDMYGSKRHAVRVEHSVNQIPPRGVEIAFQVVELCTCN